MIKTLCSGIVVYIVCSLSCMAATNSTLYTDNFENYTNGTPLIDGINRWYASSAEAIVQTNVVATGTNAAAIPIDITLSNRYAATISTNVWVHLQTKIVRYDGSTNVEYSTNSTVMFYVNSNGYCVVRNGTNSWETVTNTLSGQTADPINTNLFTTIDVYLNYTNKTWRLNVNSVPLTNNIGFINTNNSSLSSFDVYNGGIVTTYLDNVAVYDADMLPRFSLSPAGLTNTSAYRGNATSQSFEVRSTGDGQLDYYIITNDLTWAGHSPWARITNAASGTLVNNATNTVWIRYTNDTDDMVPGAYYNSFSVISTNYEGQSNNLQLTLYIQGMSVSTNSLTSSKMMGYAADTQSFNVFMIGGGTVNYAITTNPAANWLSVSPGTNAVSGGETNTHYISYFTNSLTPGTATTTLEIASLDGIVTQRIAVAMTTYSRPVPKTSFTNYSQTIQKGQLPTSTNLGLWNAGSAPIPRMTYTVTSDVSWLTLNTTSGTTTTNETNSVTVSFTSDTTNYSGLYTGRITFTGTDAGPAGRYTPIGQVTVSTQVTVSVLIIAPGKPGGLTATKGTSTDNVQLTWNTTTNLDHFELWQGTNSSVANATLFASAGTAVSYTDTGIMPGIIYYYWVRAVNAYGGAGDYSDPDTGWRYLSAPTGLTASYDLYTNGVTLNWTAAYGAQTYEIRRYEINLSNLATLVSTVSSALTAYDDTSAVVNTEYYYWIKSCTPYMSTFSVPALGRRAALMQPTGVIASDGEFTNKVRVIWQAVDNAASYEILRNTSSDLSGATLIGNSTASGYDDVSVSQGVYFYYWIRASSLEGPSRYSDYDYGWRQLVAPSGIAASDGTYPYRIRVTWDASENATGYEVWRGQGTGVGGKANAGALKLVETTSTYYNDHATIVNTPYYYRVRALCALGGAGDYSASDFGWREIAAATTTLPVKNDYDGDHLSDLPLYNSTSGVWQILCSVIGQYDLSFGDANRLGVQGDYDGDGVSDPMVYRSDNGTWFVMLSSIGYTPIIAGYFGGGGADSAPADYDGDGITDLVVYNESAGQMSVCFSSGGAFNSSVSVSIGGTGWAVVSADYDGDHKADPAVYSASAGQLAAKLSSGGYADVIVPIGGSGITMHGADYDGDVKADLVTYEESTGNWIAKLSSAGYASVPLSMGGVGYQPIPADYDGDALTDPAAYSESTGNWMIRFSASGYSLIEDTFGGTNWLVIGR